MDGEREHLSSQWLSLSLTHNGFIYRRAADYWWCNIVQTGAERSESWTDHCHTGQQRQQRQQPTTTPELFPSRKKTTTSSSSIHLNLVFWGIINLWMHEKQRQSLHFSVFHTLWWFIYEPPEGSLALHDGFTAQKTGEWRNVCDTCAHTQINMTFYIVYLLVAVLTSLKHAHTFIHS